MTRVLVGLSISVSIGSMVVPVFASSDAKAQNMIRDSPRGAAISCHRSLTNAAQALQLLPEAIQECKRLRLTPGTTSLQRKQITCWSDLDIAARELQQAYGPFRNLRNGGSVRQVNLHVENASRFLKRAGECVYSPDSQLPNSTDSQGWPPPREQPQPSNPLNGLGGFFNRLFPWSKQPAATNQPSDCHIHRGDVDPMYRCPTRGLRYNRYVECRRNTDGTWPPECPVAFQQEMEKYSLVPNPERDRQRRCEWNPYLDICSSPQARPRSQAPRLRGRVDTNQDPLLSSAEKAELRMLINQLRALKSDPSFNSATDQFLLGISDFIQLNLEFLAQNPGVPLAQVGDGIRSYLTNNNASNHQALHKLAVTAQAQFKANPARFLGQALPNFASLPKGEALAQLGRVTSGANRLLRIAAAERKAVSSLNATLTRNRSLRARFGSSLSRDICFAINACFLKAYAQDSLWAAGQSVANISLPKSELEKAFVINGVRFKGVPFSMSAEVTAEEIYAFLGNKNRPRFAPNKPGLYNPEQLDMIWRGRPIQTTPAKIRELLKENGEGSRGLVFQEFFHHGSTKLEDPAGHVFGGRFHEGKVQFQDPTVPMATEYDIFFTESLVKRWLFYPTN